MKNRNDPNQLTRHHIVPSSRKSKGIEGVCRVKRWLHEKYHQFFGNMTPHEIIVWLNETFWNNEYSITIKKSK